MWQLLSEDEKAVSGICFKLAKWAWQQQDGHSTWTLSEGDPEPSLMQWSENEVLHSREPRFFGEVIQIPKEYKTVLLPPKPHA